MRAREVPSFSFVLPSVSGVGRRAGSSLEQTMQCKRMRQEGPLLVYEHDGRTGGLTPEQSTYWGNYYRETPRDLQSVSCWQADLASVCGDGIGGII